MRVTQHVCFDELAPWSARWDELARGVPFRSWDWLELWWRHYGMEAGNLTPNKQLLLLAVWDEGRLIGIAPWYLSHVWADGRSIRPLGSGEVCSDYLTILCGPGSEECVGSALADWLTENVRGASAQSIGWDVLEMKGVVAGDRPMSRLLDHLSERGNAVYPRCGPSCWRIELPACWDEYLARLSKSHRKQVRRAGRELANGRVAMRNASTMDEMRRGFDILVDLHQRRWQSLGEQGCFASQRFLRFHREVSARLFAAGRLDLVWLELDGRPLAAEYHLLGNEIVYAYQSGVDPNRLSQEPGRLAVSATIQRNIQLGRRGYDFLRGDEPYKAHWRARPWRMWEIQVVPRRASARLRHGVLSATDSVKNWIRSGLELAGLR